MLKESIKLPIFTDGFRLIDLLCQSYPHTVWSWPLRMDPEKIWPRATDRETSYVWKISSRTFTRTKLHVRAPTGRWDIAHEVPTDPPNVWPKIWLHEKKKSGIGWQNFWIKHFHSRRWRDDRSTSGRSVGGGGSSLDSKRSRELAIQSQYNKHNLWDTFCFLCVCV